MIKIISTILGKIGGLLMAILASSFIAKVVIDGAFNNVIGLFKRKQPSKLVIKRQKARKKAKIKVVKAKMKYKKAKRAMRV